MLDTKVMTQMRELRDVGQLFFITDDTKIKGNKFYEQGKYYEALEVYEQVLGCYLWLDFNEGEAKKEKLFTEFNSNGIQDKDVDIHERQIIREEDREFETETCKSYSHLLLRYNKAMRNALFQIDKLKL